MQNLGARKAGYDFDREARRLVESSMLDDPVAGLPVDGADIIERLRVPPGPRMREILQAARRLYETKPCAKEALLAHLADEFCNP